MSLPAFGSIHYNSYDDALAAWLSPVNMTSGNSPSIGTHWYVGCSGCPGARFGNGLSRQALNESNMSIVDSLNGYGGGFSVIISDWEEYGEHLCRKTISCNCSVFTGMIGESYPLHGTGPGSGSPSLPTHSCGEILYQTIKSHNLFKKNVSVDHNGHELVTECTDCGYILSVEQDRHSYYRDPESHTWISTGPLTHGADCEDCGYGERELLHQSSAIPHPTDSSLHIFDGCKLCDYVVSLSPEPHNYSGGSCEDCGAIQPPFPAPPAPGDPGGIGKMSAMLTFETDEIIEPDPAAIPEEEIEIEIDETEDTGVEGLDGIEEDDETEDGESEDEPPEEIDEMDG